MLTELYLLQTYFEEPHSLMYEEDLVERYGREPVSEAIRAGLLEHRRIPCGQGRTRCICRLSEAGVAEAGMKIGSSLGRQDLLALSR